MPTTLSGEEDGTKLSGVSLSSQCPLCVREKYIGYILTEKLKMCRNEKIHNSRYLFAMFIHNHISKYCQVHHYLYALLIALEN